MGGSLSPCLEGLRKMGLTAKLSSVYGGGRGRNHLHPRSHCGPRGNNGTEKL